MSKICILDYGLGNVTSLNNALKHIGYKTYFYSENSKKKFDIIFIPGVGSFSRASSLFKKKNIENFIKINQKSVFFGICLGMQLMFSKGFEHGENDGLNFLSGSVIQLPKKYTLPIIGWKETLFRSHIKSLEKYHKSKFYYVHSYAVTDIDESIILSKTKYNDIFYTSSFQFNNYFGAQFHPEKSGEIGLNFIRDVLNFYNI